MTDKFQELAEHIWITTHGNKFTQRMGEETIRFTLAQIHNAALEEAQKLCAGMIEDSGEGMSIVERLTYYAKPFVRNEVRKEIINKLEKLKVKP